MKTYYWLCYAYKRKEKESYTFHEEVNLSHPFKVVAKLINMKDGKENVFYDVVLINYKLISKEEYRLYTN
jgi:hypothetical protein